MQIIHQTTNLAQDRKTAYNMTAGAGVGKMRTVAGQDIEIAAMLIYTDTGTDGNEVTVVSIKTAEGDVLATNSPSFVRDILGMVAIFGIDDVKNVRVLSCSSKSGRTYIRAQLL